MKLIILTKSTYFVEEDKIISTLFDNGMETLHLFKPETPPMYAERLLSLLPEHTHRRICVHDHFYLKSEYDLAGIHLDQLSDMPPYGYKGNVSRSCERLDSLKEAKKKSKYVFLKNIFNCIEFPSDKATFSLNQLQEASKRGLIDKHVYAMGGMSLDNVKIAKDLGFGGVVICGDLWQHFNIHQQNDYKDLLLHFEKLRKAID